MNKSILILGIALTAVGALLWGFEKRKPAAPSSPSPVTPENNGFRPPAPEEDPGVAVK